MLFKSRDIEHTYTVYTVCTGVHVEPTTHYIVYVDECNDVVEAHATVMKMQLDTR